MKLEFVDVLDKINEFYADPIVDYLLSTLNEIPESSSIYDIGVCDDGKLSYRFLSKPNRSYSGKVGRAILKISNNFNLKDIETFSHRVSFFSKKDNFEFKISKKFDYYYSDIELISGGTLSNSCMNGEYFFEMYEDTCQIITVEIEGKLAGRALLWIDDSGTKYMDRIYYCNDDVYNAFVKYAIDNNMLYKKHNDSGSYEFLDKEGNSHVVKAKFNIGYYDYYPYCDTFCSLIDNGTVRYITTNYFGGDYSLTSTDGSIPNLEYCYECGDSVDNDECTIINDEYYCSNCVVWSDLEDEYLISRYSTPYKVNGYWDNFSIDNYARYITTCNKRLYHLYDEEYILRMRDNYYIKVSLNEEFSANDKIYKLINVDSEYEIIYINNEYS